MPVIAGVDVGNATTEVAVVADGRLLGTDRLPTRGRKGSPESLRGAATLVRRLERRLGGQVDEARVAPLRAVDTTTMTVPQLPPPTGRLRVLAAGVATPGGRGACVGTPLRLDGPVPATAPSGAVIATVPPGLGYARAAERLRGLIQAGVPVAAVLVAGDEGVLVANRLDTQIPVIDQVDVDGASACPLVAVEVRAPGQPLTLLTDPVALGAALGLPDGEAGDAATLSRSLLDYSNAVVGYAVDAAGPAGPGPPEPWVQVDGERVTLRLACAQLPDWPVGRVSAVRVGADGTAADGTGASGPAEVDDLFALDLAAVGDTATARRGSLGRAVLVASLQRLAAGSDHAGQLSELLGRPVRCLLTEPAAARLGALTTPGARPDAAVVDVGAGTIDIIAPGGDATAPGAEVVAAGAGELLTAAVAETLGIPRAAAEWVKRGPCLRVDGGQRFEAEDGGRGFLDRSAPASAAGTLAVMGPAGLLPFDRRHSPAEWRAVRLRLKQAVFAVNLRRALATLGAGLGQVLIVGGPAGDDEMLGVLLRSLPGAVAVGRGNVGGTLAGTPAGHRYAAALGLALAGNE
ncbi:MAG TPA: diol dehydratase reactivase ATPase-like domain-containing protein [Streptosporangiaceae bacterium]|nr:diol dehydratase reactivase ATPase-like domain-containing protein [Streptosporangiaceae bacterium]